MLYNLNKTYKKGFALVESLVAILILSAVCATAFQVLGSSTMSITSVKNQLIAYQLANEGVELIHNAQDSIYDAWRSDDYGSISGPEWLVESADAAARDELCTILDPEDPEKDWPKFSRSCEITEIDGNNYIKDVAVTVSWFEQSGLKSIKIKSLLFR